MKLSLTQMPELKEAILSLPEKEKDKLLTRLINKDQMLIKQMHYKLLENEDDLLDRAHEAKMQIIESMKVLEKMMQKANFNKKYDYINMHARMLSGVVNEHASITKDKVSELELRLLILKLCFDQYPSLYTVEFYNKFADKHFDYVAGRVKAVLAIYDKLHPDLQYDYKEQLMQVLEFVSMSDLLKKLAQKNISILEYFD